MTACFTQLFSMTIFEH